MNWWSLPKRRGISEGDRQNLATPGSGLSCNLNDSRIWALFEVVWVDSCFFIFPQCHSPSMWPRHGRTLAKAISNRNRQKDRNVYYQYFSRNSPHSIFLGWGGHSRTSGWSHILNLLYNKLLMYPIHTDKIGISWIHLDLDLHRCWMNIT